MAILLSLETSTTICSAALHENGKSLAALETHVPQSASSRLAVMIDELFKLCERQPAEIDGVAVAAGPGSFTGLRIGVATAKGLCYALGIPLVSINTLELLAYQVSEVNVDNANLCPMLDARRMEVYCMITDSSLAVLEPTDAKIVDESTFRNWLDKGILLFFGDGAAKCKGVLSHPSARFIDGVMPSAAKLGELAYRKFESGHFEDLSSFEPFYLKDFVIGKPKSV